MTKRPPFPPAIYIPMCHGQFGDEWYQYEGPVLTLAEATIKLADQAVDYPIAVIRVEFGVDGIGTETARDVTAEAVAEMRTWLDLREQHCPWDSDGMPQEPPEPEYDNAPDPARYPIPGVHG